MFITVIQTTTTEFILSRFLCRRGSLQFLKAVRQQLADPETGSADILSSWKSECEHDRIILALPAAMLSLREVDLPLSDRKKARELLPLELKGEMAASDVEPIFEALPLTEGKTAAIWCGQQQLASAITSSAECGFDPEVATFALFNWQSLLPEKSGVTAVTDGETVAVYADNKPIFFRVLPQAGSRSLDATIAALEIAKDITVESVYTLGTAPVDTTLKTSPLPLGNGVRTAFDGNDDASADLASHFAMAQELISGDPVNLRRGPFGFTKARDLLRKKLRITWGLVAVLLILVFAEAGVRFFLVKRDVDSLDRSIRAIYKEVFPARTKAVDEVAELKAEIRKLGGSSGEGALTVLKKLTEAKGDDPIEIYEVDFDGTQVAGKGYGRSTQGVNGFKAKAGPLFSGFDVNEIKSRPDGSVGFSFRGALKGGGQ
jgi:general secretion pathway protein L